jgi:outer membrane protein insertion porin family
VILNPAGRVATQDELQSAAGTSGNLPGYRTIFLQGDSRSFDLLRISQQSVKFLSDVRASLGAEVRVQVPFINVPFRLIFAYNPNAKTDPRDPTALFLERKKVIRFSVGRTF